MAFRAWKREDTRPKPAKGKRSKRIAPKEVRDDPEYIRYRAKNNASVSSLRRRKEKMKVCVLDETIEAPEQGILDALEMAFKLGNIDASAKLLSLSNIPDDWRPIVSNPIRQQSAVFHEKAIDIEKQMLERIKRARRIVADMWNDYCEKFPCVAK